MTLLVIILTLALVLLLWQPFVGFRRQTPKDYAQTQPQFDLRQCLNGSIKSEGVLYGPMGRVVTQFTADMEGQWHGATGSLSEHFQYSSGAMQMRKWNLQMGNDGHFTATADDIIGVARGEVSGATARLEYRLRLPKEAGGHVLNVVDWMYLAENGNIINRSEMRKFGIKVAELIASMRPVNTPAE